MKSTNILYYLLIHLLFTSSLLIGFYFNEDIAGGAQNDFFIHKIAVEAFINDLQNSFFNYDKFENTHSPIFILFISSLIKYSEQLGRLTYILLSSLFPLIIFSILKLRFKVNNLQLFILSHFVLLSPYYRAAAIWPGDETISLMIFSLSILFYLKFKLANNYKNRLKYVLLNVLFLSIASYFRPIYSIFTIFFIYEFFKNFNQKIFIYYFIANIILSYPAIYYVFILEINFFSKFISSFNFSNTFALTYLTILFYLTPFLIINFKYIKFKEIVQKNLLITIIAWLIVFYFFNYKPTNHGGGFFYYLSFLLFNNSFLIFVIFPIAFLITNYFLDIKKIENFLLILILIFLEIDTQFYVETYDPLLIVIIFSLFNFKFINNYFKYNFSKNIINLFIFLFFVFSIKFIQPFIVSL